MLSLSKHEGRTLAVHLGRFRARGGCEMRKSVAQCLRVRPRPRGVFRKVTAEGARAGLAVE
jgi:hypothetical protein